MPFRDMRPGDFIAVTGPAIYTLERIAGDKATVKIEADPSVKIGPTQLTNPPTGEKKHLRSHKAKV